MVALEKTFFVEPGHEVYDGRIWYGEGLLVTISATQVLEVYVAPNGKRGACIGRHEYNKLDPEAPPPGLRRMR